MIQCELSLWSCKAEAESESASLSQLLQLHSGPLRCWHCISLLRVVFERRISVSPYHFLILKRVFLAVYCRWKEDFKKLRCRKWLLFFLPHPLNDKQWGHSAAFAVLCPQWRLYCWFPFIIERKTHNGHWNSVKLTKLTFPPPKKAHWPAIKLLNETKVELFVVAVFLSLYNL